MVEKCKYNIGIVEYNKENKEIRKRITYISVGIGQCRENNNIESFIK